MNDSIHARLARRVILTTAVLLLTWTTNVTRSHAETFEVTNTNDSGEGSLRQAIEDANGTPNAGGVPDTITFDIPGAGPHIIQPLSPLPEIIEPVVIDGFTQGQGTSGDPSDDAVPNSDPDGNNADLRIMLDGSLAAADFEQRVELDEKVVVGAVDGLVFTHPRGTAPPSELRGLAICKFSGVGVFANGSNVEVTGMSIGLDASGLPSGNLWDGVKAMGSRLIVGGRNEEDRVVIGANGDDGIHCEGSTNLCQVEGTCIGTTYDCQAGMGNLGDGVHLIDTDNSFIGETAEGAWVVIADNCGCGAHIEGFNTESSNFRNVWFGTGPGGMPPIGGKTGACVDAGVQAMFGASNFAYHTGNAISTGPGSGFTYVNQSSFYENWGLALDLLGDGLTMRNQFEIESTFPDGSILGGVVTNGDPLRSFSLECCSNANPDNTGYGECFDPYAFGSCGTDADGNGACTASGSPRPPDEPYLSCVLTDFTLGAPETFEFGPNFNRNPDGIVPTVDITCPESINVNEEYECTSQIGNTIAGRDAMSFFWRWIQAMDVEVKSVTDTDVLSCSTDGTTAECDAEIYAQDAVNIVRVVMELPEGPDTPEEITHCANAGADDSPPATACTTVKVGGAPAVEVIKTGPAQVEVMAGDFQIVTYEILVTNTGGKDLVDVHVTDDVLLRADRSITTEIVTPVTSEGWGAGDGSPECMIASGGQVGASEVDCLLLDGVLGPGETTPPLTVQVIVFYDRPYTADEELFFENFVEVTAVSFDAEEVTDTALVRTELLAPALVVEKTDSVDPVQPGGEFTYTIDVRNDGSAEAENVQVTDTLPVGVELLGTSGDGWTFDVSGTPESGVTVVATRPSIPAASSAPSIILSVRAPGDGPLENEVVATTETPSPYAPGEDLEDTTIPVVTDVFITKRVDLAKVLIDQEIEYQINVQNVGPSSAPDVVVEDSLPAGVVLVSAPASCTETTPNQLECDLGTLEGGEARTLFIRVRVIFRAGETICNMATVSTSIAEDPSNNTSEEVCTQVVDQVDLAATKTADAEQVAPGETVTYTVTVSNNGDATATQVLLEDLLPVGATVTTITPSQGTCEQPSADKITCDLGALAPDAQATVTIVVSFDAAGEPCNIVSVTSDQIDANPADNDNVDAPLCVTVAGAATCGDPVGPFLTAPGGGYATSMTEEGVTPARVTTATDALFTLQAAVGTAVCELCVCDINGSGSLTASDALLTLQLAVGQEVPLDCPPCA